MQWYGDLLGLIFLIFLLTGAANLALGGGELFRKLTTFLVATVPVLVLLGLVRAVALLRRGDRRDLAGRDRRVLHPRYEAQPGEFSADGAAARWLGTCCPAGWEPAVR